MKSARGFTLLELLISLMILATLTALSARAIQQAIFSKAKIQTQVDEMSKVRDALKIMERDINLAYHYRDLEEEFREAVAKSSIAATPTPVPRPGAFVPPPGGGFPGGAAAPTPVDPKEQERRANRADPKTEFIGTGEDMAFATMNSGRLTELQAQADFVKVGYKVETCKRLSGKQESVKCLMRRMDPLVEGDIKEGGEQTVLLENVSEFKLRYFGKGKQDWVDAWSSKDGDAVAKDSYPGAVEISLTVENGEESAKAKKRKISMQLVVPIRFPNNKEKTKGTATGGSPASGAGP
ncbi:MAG: type II secretion system protein GspJ [Bdellovibrio sp.]